MAAYDPELPFQTPEYPPSQALVATTAAPVPFTQDVATVLIQNNTAGALYASVAHTATPGDLAIASGGGSMTLICPVGTTSVSLYSTPGGTVNGVVAAGIVVIGYAR